MVLSKARDESNCIVSHFVGAKLEQRGKVLKIKVGCCGVPVDYAKYYRSFSGVEVQQTFYHPPKLSTLKDGEYKLRPTLSSPQKDGS